MMKRSNKTILVITLSILVVGLSIAYATLSQSLQINSTAQIAPGTWDIRTTLTSSSSPCTYNGTTLTSIHPTISGSGTITITIPQVGLSLPGDEVVCIIPIKNFGTIDAKLTDIDYTAPTINNQSYRTYFMHSYEYYNTSCDSGNNSLFWSVSLPSYASNVVNLMGDYFYLQPGDTDTVELYYTFSDTATTIPSSDVTLTGAQLELNYEQVDESHCSSLHPVEPM